MAARLYIPSDTTAAAMGADELHAAVARALRDGGQPVELVRNGSRGAFWLEPLVELERNGVRLAFGPVAVPDVPSLLEAVSGDPASHPLCLGEVSQIPWLAGQRRLTFGRAGTGDPLCLEHYQAERGFAALLSALQQAPAAIVAAVRDAGLRGRGGAAFPTGIKWQTVLDAPAGQKYVVCNADEGDSGTFADRLLMEADPFQLIEGMVIAGLAVGATQGYIYLRSEYPRARDVMRTAIAKAGAAGFLGADICGSGKAFHLHLCLGAGAYICGEETSLLESLEGRRPLVRAKPPLPALAGLLGRPTVVNNVLTFAAVTSILSEGAGAYAEQGSGRSRGTLTVQLAGNVRRGGLVELPFGRTLRELVFEFGGGSYSGRPVRAIQVGGPLGAYLPESQWDVPLDYESLAAAGAMLGHGGVVVFDDSVDMSRQARYAFEFCAEESCGKCTPCRVGAVRGAELVDRLRAGEQVVENTLLLRDLCATMEEGSLCAMGGLTPAPVRSALEHFAEDFPSGAGG